MMGRKEKKYYAVAKGYQVGIFDDWLNAGPSVDGYKGNLYKGYDTLEKAIEYMHRAGIDEPNLYLKHNNMNDDLESRVLAPDHEENKVTVTNLNPSLEGDIPSNQLNSATTFPPTISCVQSALTNSILSLNGSIDEDDTMYGIRENSNSIHDDKCISLDTDQTIVKQLNCVSNNTSNTDSIDNPFPDQSQLLHNHDNCDDLRNIMSEEDKSLSEKKDDKDSSNEDKDVIFVNLESLNSFVDESVKHLVATELELMKTQAKNEIKVAMTHKFQAVIDDNVSLHNKLNKVQAENQKLSSNLGDMKKFLNNMKEKFDAVVALNDRLQEQLDTVLEQQREISSIGKNIHTVLASSKCTNDEKLINCSDKSEPIHSNIQIEDEVKGQLPIIESHVNDQNSYNVEPVTQSHISISTFPVQQLDLNNTLETDIQISDDSYMIYNIHTHNSFSILADIEDIENNSHENYANVHCNEVTDSVQSNRLTVVTFIDETNNDFHLSAKKKKCKSRTNKPNIPRLTKTMVQKEKGVKEASNDKLIKKEHRDKFLSDLRNGMFKVFTSNSFSKNSHKESNDQTKQMNPLHGSCPENIAIDEDLPNNASFDGQSTVSNNDNHSSFHHWYDQEMKYLYQLKQNYFQRLNYIHSNLSYCFNNQHMINYYKSNWGS